MASDSAFLLLGLLKTMFLIPSCCRVLVSLGSDSDPAGPADPGLQKPAERGAHGLRLSQLGHFTPKARRPATTAIAAKKSKVD